MTMRLAIRAANKFLDIMTLGIGVFNICHISLEKEHAKTAS